MSPVTARLLAIRGLTDPDDALAVPRSRRSISCTIRSCWPTSTSAADRLLAAIASRERIAVHGDYDVDGITSTVILRRALELLGADVGHFIPERLTDGYGLQPGTIDRLHAEGVQLVVSVDCGIRGAEAARRARELGVDLIITDHHEPDTELPRRVRGGQPEAPRLHAIPTRTSPASASRSSWCRRSARGPGKSAWLPAFVKIAAIGTLADVVPLVGENRIIAKLGLQMLTQGPAQGRPARAARSRGPDRQDHRQLSHRLHGGAAHQRRRPHEHARHRHAAAAGVRRRRWPTKRRRWPSSSKPRTRAAAQEDQDILAKAKKIVETDPDIGSRSVLVVAGEGWHRGVIGIVASKLVDAFYRPAIVLSIDGDVAHGSCRSIPASTCSRALESCAPMLRRFGGHKQAAGLQIETSRIKEFRQAVNAHADAMPRPGRPASAAVARRPAGVQRDQRSRDRRSSRRWRRSAPAIRGRSFHTGPVSRSSTARAILKERHLKMSVKQDGRVLRAIQWNAAERETEPDRAEGRRRDRLHGRRERVPRREVRGAAARRLPLAPIDQHIDRSRALSRLDRPTLSSRHRASSVAPESCWHLSYDLASCAVTAGR